MRRTQRLISFILAMVMVISSVNLVLARTNANSSSDYAGTPGGVGGGVGNLSNGYSTGYKIQLVFLPVEGLELGMDTDERDKLLDLAWNKATPESAIQIGKAIYLTTESCKAGTSKGFRQSDFYYGLGTKTGIVSREKDGTGVADVVDIPKYLLTPQDINTVISGLNIPAFGSSSKIKYSGNTMQMSTALPISIGSNATSGADLKSYFMTPRTEADKLTDPDLDADYYSTSNFAGLVNYLSTGAGENKEDFIYFARIKNADGTIQKYDELIPKGANCFESGYWQGSYGEFRLVVSNYWVLSSGTMKNAAFTLRDFAWLYNSGNASYKQVTIDQQPYVAALGFSTRLESNDIWGLQSTQRSDWEKKSAKWLVDNVYTNLGGGLSFFTSSMMHMDVGGTPNYIGSITNVFLPNSLDKDDSSIKTASLEYIGPKSGGTNDSTTTALENASIQLAKAMSGETVSASDNIYTSKDLTNQSILLNGTIKLPGIQEDNTSATGLQATQGYAERYMSELRALIDGTGEGTLDLDQNTRDSIKRLLLEELGIDLDATNSTDISLTDLSLAMYVLSHYQLDGVEANGTGYEVYNSPANRWKMILAYQGMLENEKSAKAIDTSSEDGGAWAGPLSITASDINNYDTNKGFNTAPLKNNDTSKLKGYPQTSEGASKAIEDKVLDNTQTGQISIQQNSQSVWKEMLGAGDLDSGLVRVPIAMGTTQMHLMTGDDKSFNLQKAQLGQIQADVLKGLVSACFDENGKMKTTTVRTTDALSKLWSKADILEQEYPANLPDYHGNTSGMLSTEADLDDITTGSEATIKGLLKNNNSLFAQVVKGDSFNSVYNKINDKGKSSAFNTFGLNTLINIAIPLHLGQYTNDYTTTGYAMSTINPELGKGSENGVYTNPGGIVAVPSYTYYGAEADSSGKVTMQSIADSYKKTLSSMTSSARTINDAIFATTSNNRGSLMLAASNYLLNKGLADSKTEIRTDVVSDIPVTNIKGDYGLSYIIWDAAMPVDIQLVTEVDGEIVPIEGAADGYTGGLISNVWYAVPNQDKALELQKYYTVKKGDEEVTLEVEEAVVKSATVNDADTLKDFYTAYRDAYTADKDSFTYKGKSSEDAEKADTTYTTTRTKFNKQSASGSNVESYTYTHTNVSTALRYITSTGAGLGLPTSVGNLTGYVVNTMDIVPSTEDKEVYLDNTSKNRLQVIVKVKASTKLVQYNMVEGLDGNYVIETEPKLTEDGKIQIDNYISTKLGTAYLTGQTQLNGNPISKICAFTSTIDKNPNEEKPILENGIDVWNVTEDSMPEWAKTVSNEGKKNYFYQYSTVKDSLTEDEKATTDDTTASVDWYESLGADYKVEYDPKVRAVYVHYVERPPLYEVYRKSDGSEEVVKREQGWDGDTLNASSGKTDGKGQYDNLIGDSHIYHPVMAVAADLNYGVDESTPVIEVGENGNTINTPENWKWVTDNLTTVKGAKENVKNKQIGYFGGKAYDVQTVGLDGLYKTAKGEPIQITSFSDTEGSGFFGSSRSEWSSGYYTPATQQTYTTDEGKTVTRIDDRLLNLTTGTKGDTSEVTGYDDSRGGTDKSHGFSTSVSPTFAEKSSKLSRAEANDIYGKGLGNPATYYLGDVWSRPPHDGLFETVNRNLFEYDTDYTQPNYYTIYILYVQGEQVNNIQNSFYAVLPQDMITRAVAYKDLARQYYQREQVVRYKAHTTENSLGDKELGKTARIPISEFVKELEAFITENFNNISPEGGYSVVPSKQTDKIYVGFKQGENNGTSLTFTYRTRNSKNNNATLVTNSWGESQEVDSDNLIYRNTNTINVSSGKYPYLYAYAKAAEGNLQDLADRLNNVLSSDNVCSLNGKLYYASNGNRVTYDFEGQLKQALANIASKVLVGGNNCVQITESGQAVGDSSNYWKCNFNTWYTLYINMGDPSVQRVSYDGTAGNAEGKFETPGTKEFNDDTYAVRRVGPTGKQLGVQYLDGTNYFKPTKSNYQYETADAEGNVTTNKITVFAETVEDAGSLANYYAVEFGIQGYGDGVDTTPGTVANNKENEMFFASKPYDSNERLSNRPKLAQDKNGNIGFEVGDGSITGLEEDTGYWKDYYHYYNDYNFYVLVWRGMDRPNLSSAASESEQIANDGNVSEIQKKAVLQLCTDAIGRTDKYVNQFTGTVYQPTNNAAVTPNYWLEAMYPAYVNMGATTDKKDKSLMYNGFHWQYSTKGDYDTNTQNIINSNGKHLNADGSTGEQDIGAGDGGSLDINTSDLSNGGSFTTFKGNLLVDSLADNAGVGNINSINEVSSSPFTLQGGERYNRQTLHFSKAITQGIGNTWTPTSGTSANLWVNYYPWVKMRYQTVRNDMYYTPKQGGTPVETKDAYVISKNQSTLVLNSVLDIGFSRGEGSVTSTDGTTKEFNDGKECEFI